jgi:hypothetical protein
LRQIGTNYQNITDEWNQGFEKYQGNKKIGIWKLLPQTVGIPEYSLAHGVSLSPTKIELLVFQGGAQEAQYTPEARVGWQMDAYCFQHLLVLACSLLAHP